MSYREAAERAHSDYERLMQAKAKLERIAALCDRLDFEGYPVHRIDADKVRTILDGGIA